MNAHLPQIFAFMDCGFFFVGTIYTILQAPTTDLLPSPPSDNMCALWRRDTGAGLSPSVHSIYYPASAWLIQLRAYAMPSVPVPPIILLTDMVSRCRLFAAHGARSCLSVRSKPLTATGTPSQTSTVPYHTTPLGFFFLAFYAT